MRKLLLADDSVTIQRVIELTFSGEDIQVIAVSDGEQAITRIPIEQPDVILADIGMPKQSGYDVAAFVAGRQDLAHIPVLLLAGAFERVDEARAEQVRCAGILVKPFEPRHVVSRVRELISTPRSVRPPVPAPAPAVVEPPPPAPDPAPAIHAAPSAASHVEAPPAPVEPIAASTPAVADAFLDETLDDYFERLNAAFSEPEPPAAPRAVAPEPAAAPHALVLEPPAETFDAPPAAVQSVDGYFDRLSAAFADLARPQRESDELPASFDDLGSGGWVPTVQDLLDESGPGAITPPVEPLTPEVALQSAALAPDEIMPTPARPAARFGDRPEASGEDLGGIADVLTALLAEPGGSVDHAAAPDRAAAPASAPALSSALVEEITGRVLDRLVPEVTARLKQIVLEEIGRGNRRQ